MNADLKSNEKEQLKKRENGFLCVRTSEGWQSSAHSIQAPTPSVFSVWNFLKAAACIGLCYSWMYMTDVLSYWSYLQH